MDPVEGCLYCHESVDLESDSWREVGFVDMLYVPHLRVVHLECYTRSITGDVFHLAERCSCFGGEGHDDRPWREQAKSVAAFFRLRAQNADLSVADTLLLAYHEGSLSEEE